MNPVVSIIICTRNRAESLRQTIEAISQCKIPADLPAELLIIDNGSADQTREMAAETQIPNLLVRYIHEASAGQSHARNRGMREAAGKIFLFTDDDVRVPPNWIEGMCRPIFTDAADAVAGGVVFPESLDRELRACRSWFATTEAIIRTRPDRFVGANMAFSRAILAKVPSFDIELGPGALGFGDDTLFCYQLRHAGFRLTTCFDIAVEHHFQRQRLARSPMLEMARQMGKSKAYVDYHWRHLEIDPQPLKELGDRKQIWSQRLLHPKTCQSAEQPTERELRLIEQMALRSFHLQLSYTERKYDRNGLIKLSNLRAA